MAKGREGEGLWAPPQELTFLPQQALAKRREKLK